MIRLVLHEVDPRYVAKVLVAFVDGPFEDRAHAFADTIAGAPVSELVPRDDGYSVAMIELPGVVIELADNRRHGMVATLSWEPEQEQFARDGIAYTLETLGWTAWSITSFDGSPRWPELVSGGPPGVESALEAVENRLRQVQKLREIQAPPSICGNAEKAVRDAVATARSRGWDGRQGTLPVELFALLRLLEV